MSYIESMCYWVLFANGSGSEELWAKHGLTGLVLFALFGLILIFIKVLGKKDEGHQKFLKTILEEERGERSLERVERKEARRENHEVNKELAKAIDGLSMQIYNSARKEEEKRELEAKISNDIISI